MKTRAIPTIVLLFALSAGCGTRSAYESLRYRQDIECQKLYGTEKDDCMRRSAPSYDEYQRRTREHQDDKR
jgi:hypothetical protein